MTTHWRGLDALEQAPRYEAIGRMIARHAHPEASILDVGAGCGILSPYVRGPYTGIDPSREATATPQAQDRQIERIGAEDFVARGTWKRWDAIVFNEMLYYCADPCELLRKYARLLTPNGVIVVSIWMKFSRPSIWQRVRCLGGKRPLNNTHCAVMVEGLFAEWKTLGRAEIGSPIPWRIWAVRPTHPL